MRENGELDRALGKRGYSETVREAALNLDSRLPEALVVRAAKTLAVSGEEPGRVDPNAPLGSVFNSIQLCGRPRPERRIYRPVEYGGGEVRSYLPSKQDTDGDQDKLKGAFVRKLGELERTLYVNSVLNLLERYGSHLSSGTGADDVSLFDHSRATAALAVCIAGHLNSTGEELEPGELERMDAQRYLFVRGDISGVQKFIYTITSKGALRMLRARSFFLELLAEHAVSRILERFGVPRTNAIYVGGGGFQLLLPNTSKSKEAVERVKDEMNETLASSFSHDLYLALSTEPCGASGIAGEGLGETLKSLGERLSQEKARKFRASLPRLLGEQREPGAGNCDVCTRDDIAVNTYDPRTYGPPAAGGAEEPITLCDNCHMLARASRKLVSGRYLTASGSDFRIGESGYGLSGDGRNALYALDGVGDEACLMGAVPLPVARRAARDRDQILDFDGLSERAVGIPRLAVLRMDVDNLSEVFRSGLPKSMRTFSRYAALSRAFTTFFKMVLPKICEGSYENSLRLFGKEKERVATVVYSGGDDLFIVGAWSDVLELAVDVRRAFKEFVCENPSVTLSAGISLHRSGEPLYLMAEVAGTAEETAKKNRRDGREKDSAVLFHRGPDAREIENIVPGALFWEDVEGVVSLLERFDKFRGPDRKLPFPRGFMRLLLDVVDVYEQEGHLSLPRLAYALARMEESGKLKKNKDWQELKRKLLEIETIEKHLRPAATWLDLAERGEEA
jgi:CRISPR-associated protein Csm1